jgi:hypothetical protein
MRTTLTLDDDVAAFLLEQRRLQDKPFRQLVNEVLRRGMSPSASGAGPGEFRVEPNRSGLVPGVDPGRLNQLSDELEADDFAEECAG